MTIIQQTFVVAAALEAGEINEPTSRLYRTWAEFGDPSLPEQYQGAPDAHVLDLLVDLPSRLDELPDDVRTQVEPYFLRPTDPNSAFNANDDPPGLRSGRSAPFTSKTDPPIPWWQCRDGWAVEPVPDLPFVVWICLDLDRSAPDATANAVATGYRRVWP